MSTLQTATPAKSIDVKGQICPYPLIAIKNALKELQGGQVLEVHTDWEPTVKETAPGLCRKLNYPIETIRDEAAKCWRVYIQKP
jgi:TusA-related sulfurtransferase